MPVKLQNWRLLSETLATELPVTPRAQAFRAHITSLLAEFGIRASWAATAAVNAYAFTASKAIECPPICSAWSAAAAYHEVGHVAAPCTARHTASREPGGRDALCSVRARRVNVRHRARAGVGRGNARVPRAVTRDLRDVCDRG